MSQAARPLSATNYQVKLKTLRFLVYVLVTILSVACIIPLYLMVVNATRTNNDILSSTSFIPGDQALNNLDTLINGRKLPNANGEVQRTEALNIPLGIWNSLIVTTASTILAAYFSTLTAYGFVLYRFRLKKVLWLIILAVIMLPPTVGLIGYYKLVASLNLLDTFWPLILPSIASPFAVFFMRQYLATALPASLVEASRIDGAGEFMTFNQIALPIAAPGIATIGILGFLGSWNSYLNPLIVITSKDLQTLPLLIQQLNTSTYNKDFGAMYMGITLSVIPILIVFSLFSRYLIEGMTAGSVKE